MSTRLKGGLRRNPWAASLVPFGTSAIDTASSTGATFTITTDAAVLWDGKPTTKVAIAGSPSSNALDIGTAGASITLTLDARKFISQGIALAVKGTQISTLATIKLFVGDAGYTNTYDVTSSNYVDTADGWRIFHIGSGEALVATGTPNTAAAVRAKVRLTMGSGTWATGDIWIAACSSAPLNKPTVVFTCDDGRDEWYTYLYAACKARSVPVSLGIDQGYVGNAGYITTAQIQEMAADESGLFEFTNHGVSNQSFVGVGQSAYVANLATCDAYLSSIGIPLKSRMLHALVQGSYDADLIAAMQGLGYTSIREVGAAGRIARPLLTRYAGPASDTRHSRYTLPATANLQSGTSVATVKGYIETAKAQGGTVFLMGHAFDTVATTLTWVSGYDAAHGMNDLLDYLAAERDAGRIELMLWSAWAARLSAGDDI